VPRCKSVSPKSSIINGAPITALSSGDGRDVTVELGTNGKMNEFCAAMGLTNLDSPG
jgi:hypothetical protein